MARSNTEPFKFDVAQLFIPLLVWISLLIMPVMSNAILGINLTSIWYINILSILLGAMILFYLDFYIFVDKMATRKRWWQYVLVNIALSAVLMFLCALLIILLRQTHRLGMSRTDVLIFNIGGYSIMLITALLSLAVRASKIAHLNGIQVSEMAKLQVQSELQGLKSQINPHFLFNTLNNIYSLIDLDAKRAQKAVHDLSHLLRYVIYESSAEKVPLSKEVDFIREYVKLEKLRLGSNVKLSVEFPENTDDMEIAPLILVPFIENAFKHGVSYSSPSSISIKIALDNRTLACRITNTNHPVKKSNGGSGIGIHNTQKRLSLVYPDRYGLKQELRTDGIFETYLEILL